MQLLHVGPGAERAVAVDPGDLASVREQGGWLWLDLVGADEETVERIGAEFGFDHLAIEDVLAVTEFPKADDYPGHSLAVLHGVADDSEQFRTIEYDSFVGPGYLVVFRREELAGFGWVWEQILAPDHVPPEGPDRLFARMVETGATRFSVLVDALAEHVEQLEDRAMSGDPGVIAEVHALRRDVLNLRRILVPQRDTVGRLGTEVFPGIGERARLRLRSAHDHYERAAESLDSSRAMLGAVLETYRAVVAERANEVMKVLAVFAAILLPLSVIAGIYGMNFSNMPELAWRWTYFAALGVMATVAITLWLYFARRGFIGGPKLGRLPKVVGSGLAGLVRLTTKPVGSVGRILTGKRRPL